MSPELALKALQAAPDGTVIIEGSGIIQFANRQAAAMFGYGEQEMLGNSIEMLLPERFRGRHVSHRQAFMADVRVRPMGVGLQLSALRKDGTEFPVEISLSPLEDGPRTLVAASIRDVTRRHRMESELRHLQSITDTALSSENTETLVRALLSRLRAALQSDTATILLAEDDGRYLVPVASEGMEAEIGGEIRVPLGRGVAGQIALSESPLILEDLSQVEVVSPVLRSRVRSVVGMALRRQGQLLGVIHAGSLRARRFTEDEARLMALAADRIGLAVERARLHDREQQARESAEAANRTKSRFLATASHDLRQPLQTIALLNGTLRRACPQDDAQEALELQEQGIDSMSRLLNALLDISKLESGAVKPAARDFILGDVFQVLQADFARLAADKGLRFSIEECAAPVHTDPALLEQILRNLVSNAVKYTRAGSVDLRCRLEAAAVRLEVKDTGIGIPEDQIRHIYDEFFQVGVPTNSTREGYGLGLSIVQRLVTLLNLKLEVHSQVGKGTVFALTLPTGNPGQHRAAPVQKSAPTSSPWTAKVLLVEDDQAVRNATRLLLKSAGYVILAAASLSEALRLAAADPQIDLLVTDYHLEDGKTGTDVITAIRGVLGKPLKAILITGDTSSVIADLGADQRLRIVSKPINADEFLRLLKELLAAA